jgi:hypothetical protein
MWILIGIGICVIALVYYEMRCELDEMEKEYKAIDSCLNRKG